MIPIKFYIYSRKSVDTGRGDSIENQVILCQQYINSKFSETSPLDIAVYEDEGYSGKTTNRPQFQRMMADMRENPPDFLVCYRLDRISRSVSDFSALIEEFNRQGVSFLCIKEEFDTSKPMGKAMLYIASVFAQLERETIAERVRDNMLLLARSGRWLGGTPPLGFTAQPSQIMDMDGQVKMTHQLTAIPLEAQIVKQIFAQYLRIQSLSGLEKWLTAHHITTGVDAPFSLLSLRDILQNPVYATADRDSFQYFSSLKGDLTFSVEDCNHNRGLMVYNKRDYTKKNAPRQPIDRWIVAIGQHPGLISGGDWVKVQQILHENQSPKKFPPRNHNALLSGVLRCAICGSPMFAKGRWNQDRFDYICQRKLRGGALVCPCQNLNGQETDAMVFSALLPWIQPSDLNPILRKISEQLERNPIKLNQDTTSKQRSKLLRQREDLMNLLADHTFTPQLKQEIEMKITQLSYKVELLSIPVISDDIPSLSQSLLHIIHKPQELDPAEKRIFLKKLLREIIWDSTRLIPCFYDELAPVLEVDSLPSLQF